MGNHKLYWVPYVTEIAVVSFPNTVSFTNSNGGGTGMKID